MRKSHKIQALMQFSVRAVRLLARTLESLRTASGRGFRGVVRPDGGRLLRCVLAAALGLKDVLPGLWILAASAAEFEVVDT